MRDASTEEIQLIERAFAFSKKAHEGQTRFNGEPYFSHAFNVGKILASIGIDAKTIAAGLLHDTVEDANIEAGDIEKEFGTDVSFLVEGVTKLGTLKYRGLERHVESLRKLFVATAQDPRVIIIKLADRLHNVRTLEGHPKPEKRKRIALETLEIFAPLAGRLGMGKLKGELEDASFPYVYEEEFAKTLQLRSNRGKDVEKSIDKFHTALLEELDAHHLTGIETDYRVKHLYSLWRKLKKYDMDIDKIHDILALRVIVPSIEVCYQVLGIIHGKWRPLPGRIKDYIALPKPNGYQSLHTTIFGGDGSIIEVQIRTRDMHHEAEYGIASHLAYKTGTFEKQNGNSTRSVKRKLAWIRQLFDWQQQAFDNSGEYLSHLKFDFFEDRVFVYTPKGDTIDLPNGATPVDFAYVVHSDVGNHLSGAKVNGKLVQLNYQLKTGDIIEIITKKKAGPTRKWLDHAKTSLAQRHIRSALQKKESERRS